MKIIKSPVILSEARSNERAQSKDLYLGAGSGGRSDTLFFSA